MWLLLACTKTPGDSGDPMDSAPAAVDGCHATPRKGSEHALWVSFPYADDNSPADTWWTFTFDGAIEAGEAHELGRSTAGRGAWTPDGAFVYLVDEDGVVHTPTGPWTEQYISSITIDRTGEVAWLINPNWADSGGGVYAAPIDCDTGALGAAELVWTGKNASVVALRPGTSEAAILTRELDGVAGIVHRVDLETRQVLASIDAFGDDEAIVSDAAWDAEGERLLVADYSQFSGVSTRVAVVGLEAAIDVIDVPDPVSIVTAPWPGSSALVVSGYDDAVFELERTADGYALGGEVASPALPGSGVVTHAGQVLVVDSQGIWGLQFVEGGGVTDQGLLWSGSGLSGIPGAIALQP